jgi:hypothetical protein
MAATKSVPEMAAEIAIEPLVAERPEQWGLLTALSPAAKERKQVHPKPCLQQKVAQLLILH